MIIFLSPVLFVLLAGNQTAVHVALTVEARRHNSDIILDERPPFQYLISFMSIPVSARSQAGGCGRSLSGILGSNPAGGMDVCLL